MVTALGAELGRGEPAKLTLEDGAGAVLVGPLVHGAALVMLTSGAPILGRLRRAIRRFRDQYAEASA